MGPNLRRIVALTSSAPPENNDSNRTVFLGLASYLWKSFIVFLFIYF